MRTCESWPMSVTRPFSFESSSRSPDSSGVWREAIAELGRGSELPLQEALKRLSDSGADEVWGAWSRRRPLLDFERSQREAWDAQDRSWLLPILWSCADQAGWQHRYPLAEQLAKRAVGRTLELTELEPAWAVFSYLALGRAYLAQGRLELAQSLLENLPPCRDPEVAAWAALHRAEWWRRQGRLQEASRELDQARLMGGEAITGSCMGFLQAWLGQRLSPAGGLETPVGRLLRARQALQVGRGQEAVHLLAGVGEVFAPALGSTTLARADGAFAMEDWEAAAAHYRDVILLLVQLKPGELAAGPFDPLPWAWPCLADLAWPWPLAFPAYSLAEATQTYLFCQGQLARCLRSLGRVEEAREVAGEAKSVRQTSGQVQLVALNERAFRDTVSLRLILSATGRQPRWLAWDSASGDLQTLTPDKFQSKPLLVGPMGTVGEGMARELFEAPLTKALELTLYASKARAGRIEAVTYALWVGFSSGPPLYLPVTVGGR